VKGGDYNESCIFQLGNLTIKDINVAPIQFINSEYLLSIKIGKQRKESVMAKKTNTSINGNEYYRVRARIGVIDNKPVIKAFYGNSKKEAEESRDAYINGSASGIIDYDKILFGNFYKEWFDVIYAPSLKQNSVNRFEIINRLWIQDAKFYKMPLISIKTIDIQKHINSLKSASNAKLAHLLVNKFLKYCIGEQIITYNPAANVSLPKRKTTKDFKPLSNLDMVKLMNGFKDDSSLFVYVFAVFTGLRQGELIGLKRYDVDFLENLISVNKSLKRVSFNQNGVNRTQIELGMTKNEYSIRDIPIMKEILPSLKEHMLHEKEKYFKIYGAKIPDDVFLFTSSTGAPLRGDHLTARWHKVQSELGIKDTNFHYLRHTFCTLLARNNVPLKTASMLMGHSNIQTTAEIYTHVDIKEKEIAVDSLGSYFASN